MKQRKNENNDKIFQKLFRPGTIKDHHEVVGRVRVDMSDFARDRVHDKKEFLTASDGTKVAEIEYRITVNGMNTASCRKG